MQRLPGVLRMGYIVGGPRIVRRVGMGWLVC